MRDWLHAEEGSAVIEFLTVTLVLLVPTVYLLLAFFQIQAASFAAEGAARDAGRILATARNEGTGRSAAAMSAQLAFEDFGLATVGPPRLTIDCEADPCLTGGARIHVTVAADVPLPLISTGVARTAGMELTVEGAAVAVVDRFRERQ